MMFNFYYKIEFLFKCWCSCFLCLSFLAHRSGLFWPIEILESILLLFKVFLPPFVSLPVTMIGRAEGFIVQGGATSEVISWTILRSLLGSLFAFVILHIDLECYWFPIFVLPPPNGFPRQLFSVLSFDIRCPLEILPSQVCWEGFVKLWFHWGFRSKEQLKDLAYAKHEFASKFLGLAF